MRGEFIFYVVFFLVIEEWLIVVRFGDGRRGEYDIGDWGLILVGWCGVFFVFR